MTQFRLRGWSGGAPLLEVVPQGIVGEAGDLPYVQAVIDHQYNVWRPQLFAGFQQKIYRDAWGRRRGLATRYAEAALPPPIDVQRRHVPGPIAQRAVGNPGGRLATVRAVGTPHRVQLVPPSFLKG